MRFESVVVLRAELIEKLGDQTRSHLMAFAIMKVFQHSKIWICNNDDLEKRYHKINSGEISLWCEGALSSTV